MLRGYNHWTAYAAFALLTYVAPLGVLTQLVAEEGIGIHSVADLEMYPTLHAGDLVLWYKSDQAAGPPQRGDLVITEEQGRHSLLRVVAVAGDEVRVEGDWVFINGEMLDQEPFSSPSATSRAQDGKLEMHWERNHSSRYPVSKSPSAFSAVVVPPTQLQEGEVFLLTDNRSEATLKWANRVRDSRLLGPVSADSIRGRPKYIAWAHQTASGTTNWARIGIRVD